MTLVNRVNLEPAFVLHTRAFKETSLLVDLFTKNLGRITLVAKGARKSKSSLRSVLTPASLFAISFGGKSELKNLNACEILNHYSLSMPVSPCLNSSTVVLVHAASILTNMQERDNLIFEVTFIESPVISILLKGYLTNPALLVFEQNSAQSSKQDPAMQPLLLH